MVLAVPNALIGLIIVSVLVVLAIVLDLYIIAQEYLATDAQKQPIKKTEIYDFEYKDQSEPDLYLEPNNI